MPNRYIDVTSKYLANISFTAENYAAVSAFIEAATVAVEKWCNRIFIQQEYDEIQTVLQDGSVMIANYPLVSLDRVLTNQEDCISVQNTTATNASFSVSAENFILTRITGGLKTTTKLALATYPTITLLVAAINAVGNGWVASAIGSYGPYPSSDLVYDQYASCKQKNSALIWLDTDSNFLIQDHLTGIIASNVLSRGMQVRLQYEAGFDTIPEPVAMSVAEIVKIWYAEQSTYTTSQSIGIYSYSQAEKSIMRIPLQFREALTMYKDRRI